MQLFRLCARRHARVLDGVGAALFPGRWNGLDTPMIYCGGNPATCLAEVLVHTDLPPADHVMVTLDIPDRAPLWQPGPNDLPDGWDRIAYSDPVRQFGDAFVSDGRYLVLKVPSVVVPGEFNYLINPRHPAMEQVSIVSVEAFVFDPRLF